MVIKVQLKSFQKNLGFLVAEVAVQNLKCDIHRQLWDGRGIDDTTIKTKK